MAASPELASIPYEAFENICDHCSMLDVIRLKRVSRKFREMCYSYLQVHRRRWHAELHHALGESGQRMVSADIESFIIPGNYEHPDPLHTLKNLLMLQNLHKLECKKRWDFKIPYPRGYSCSRSIEFLGRYLVLLYDEIMRVIDCETSEDLYHGISHQGKTLHAARVFESSLRDENFRLKACVDVLVVLCGGVHPSHLVMYDSESILEPEMSPLHSKPILGTVGSWVFNSVDCLSKIADLNSAPRQPISQRMSALYPGASCYEKPRSGSDDSDLMQFGNVFRAADDGWSGDYLGFTIDVTHSMESCSRGLKVSIMSALNREADPQEFIISDLISPIRFCCKVLHFANNSHFVFALYGRFNDESEKVAVLTFSYKQRH